MYLLMSITICRTISVLCNDITDRDIRMHLRVVYKLFTHYTANDLLNSFKCLQHYL